MACASSATRWSGTPQKPAFFEGAGRARRSARRSRPTSQAVVGRYRGRAVGWDVVNEAVTDDGAGWRDSLWSQRLGRLDHMRIAYDLGARRRPRRGALPQRLQPRDQPEEARDLPGPRRGAAEGRRAARRARDPDPCAGRPRARRDHRGAEGPRQPRPEGADLRDGRLAGRRRGLASFTGRAGRRQAALYAEAAEAFAALPPRQRSDFTFWGLEDSQSWLRARTPRTHPCCSTTRATRSRRRGVGGRPKAHALGLCRGSRAGRNARTGPGEGPGAVW